MYTLQCAISQPDYTLDCGQVFRWDKIGDVWIGVVQGDVVRALAGLANRCSTH